METWEPAALPGSGKTNFLWQRERCRAVDTADYFSCSLMRRGAGGGEKRARKRGKLNPHVLSLLKGPDSKPEMKLRLQFWLLAGLFPASPSLTGQGGTSPPDRIRSDVS